MNVPNTYASALASLQVLKLEAEKRAGFTIGGPILAPQRHDCECGRPGRRRYTPGKGNTVYVCDRCAELDGVHPAQRRALELLEDGVSMSTEDVANALGMTRLAAYRLLLRISRRGRLRTWLEIRTRSAERGTDKRQTNELRMWRRAW